MARNIGISATTYQTFQIDAGAIYTGFTDFSTKGTLLGATRGGSTFTIEPEYREMEVDGARGPVVGSRRLTRVVAKLTVNIIEQTLANWKMFLPGSASAAFNTSWDAVTRSVDDLDTSDHLTNVILITDNTAETDPMGFLLSNPIVDSPFELSAQDKEEGVIPVTFTAHFAADDLDTEPWTLYYPNGAS